MPRKTQNSGLPLDSNIVDRIKYFPQITTEDVLKFVMNKVGVARLLDFISKTDVFIQPQQRGLQQFLMKVPQTLLEETLRNRKKTLREQMKKQTTSQKIQQSIKRRTREAQKTKPITKTRKNKKNKKNNLTESQNQESSNLRQKELLHENQSQQVPIYDEEQGEEKPSIKQGKK